MLGPADKKSKTDKKDEKNTSPVQSRYRKALRSLRNLPWLGSGARV